MKHGDSHCGRRMSIRVGTLIMNVTLLLVPRPLNAQLFVGADATFASGYVWRGLSRVSSPVLQPSVYVALGFGSSFLTTGIWGNVELERATAYDHTLVGPGSRGAGEANVWLEYTVRRAAFDWRVGLWHYRLDDPRSTAGLPASFSTTELHAAVATLHLPVLVRLSGWLDAGRLRGVYYELDASYPLGTHPLGEVVGSLFVGGRAGASHGLSRAADAPANPFYFHHDGIVYYELYAQLAFESPLRRLPLVCNIAPRYEFARDPATRRESLDPALGERASFFWIEIALSWRSRLAGIRR